MGRVFFIVSLLALCLLAFVFMYKPDEKAASGKQAQQTKTSLPGNPSKPSSKAQPGTAREMYLVKDGLASGEFVLAEDAAQAEIFGASDVRHWIKEITGAEVPILRGASEKKNTKIFVGTKLASEFKEDLAKLADNDGFAIRNKNGNVYVFGSRPRGTMYGLFSFLERNSDLIWARPNERFGTVFGQTKNLQLTDTDCLDIPVFNHRSLGAGYPPHIATGEWQLRNRNNQCGRLYGPELDMVGQMGHNLATPISDLFKDHPEYFAYYPATKQRKGVKHGEGSMCISYPGLPEIWAKECMRLIAEKEKETGSKISVFNLGPGDNWYCCQCPECMKPLKLPDGTSLEMKDPDATKDPLFRSTQIFMFLNEAMKTWEKERPDVQLSVLAYIHLAEPPKVKLHPKLAVFFAPYPTNTMHFPLLDQRQAPQWRERFEKWLQMANTLGFYEYFYSKPSPLAYYAAENLRALLKTPNYKNALIYSEFDNDRDGPEGAGIGGNFKGWDLGGMNTWVIARLFWNPNQDVDSLYRYYIKRTYREAAPEMTEYYEMIKKSWLDPDDKTWDGAHGSMFNIYDNMILKKKLEPKLFDILERAEKAAKTPNSKHMIKRMREGYAGFSEGISRLVVANIPEMAHDGESFESVQWEKPESLNDFRTPPPTRIGPSKVSSQASSLKAAHDGTNLYLRFTASDSKIANIKTIKGDGKTEIWPKDDHIEFWLNGPGGTYIFAFDAEGNKYDSKNYDRDWNSLWKLKVKKTESGYEAIAIIPLFDLGLAPKQETKLQWFCVREINHKDSTPEESTYKGQVLYKSFFPIIMQ
ncbi:MAG: hypothetical protein A2X49_12890 [Lentisphaerae bacterium GWF2_52_8]|nr:MAG: hypothetical protein A2X49_12890 [Lentisphaerae bacterium GWF2_52_8]